MNKENTKYQNKQNRTEPNRDPITGTPGAHPDGTGVGAASDGAAVAALHVNPDLTYVACQPAYRPGYGGPSRSRGKKYQGGAADLQREYETAKGNAGLAWSKAKPAPRDAWTRVQATLPVGSDRD